MKTVDTISSNFVQLFPPKEPENFSLTMVKKIVKRKLPHLTTPTKSDHDFAVCSEHHRGDLFLKSMTRDIQYIIHCRFFREIRLYSSKYFEIHLIVRHIQKKN